MSFGMVLCSSTADAVEPLRVPEGVANGERVTAEGYAEAQPPLELK